MKQRTWYNYIFGENSLDSYLLSESTSADLGQCPILCLDENASSAI